ncbi:hypothetical protein F2P56_018674 [Juglans regia]|uniref:RNase H type-1 domain-containing protein n=2 Tax=Juglans regia TaxID=51240 RepID=A0A833UV90_JUGRE|nr:uncharacterized protein LOC108997753 [Juglans regia]KAF5462687.1 hypothetical protein F2P56_018674 [Juglans regia]
MVHEQVLVSPKTVADNALGLIMNYVQLHLKSQVQAKHHFHWTAPLPGLLKLNVDGAMFGELCKSGVGCILRDDKGKVLMAALKAESEVEEPEAVELIVVLRGLQLCVSMGISRIQVESDCLLVVEALEHNNMAGSLLGLLYQDIKSISSCFVECSFVYVPREGNRAAHGLAIC